MRDDLPDPIRTEAQKLFDLVGLGRRPSKDPRWRKRRTAWRRAEWARQRVEEGADADWVIQLAQARGFFSVWMTVFADDPQVCDRLRRSFPGTR
ncbi:MAG: hypothetical protein OXE49_22275 [Gemmatimonadetes bacterium]|nr:hypothetical protein [Gemmatimonadota bacterium]